LGRERGPQRFSPTHVNESGREHRGFEGSEGEGDEADKSPLVLVAGWIIGRREGHAGDMQVRVITAPQNRLAFCAGS
jgi:hypothetical protein